MKGEHLKIPDGTIAIADGGSTPKVRDCWMWDLASSSTPFNWRLESKPARFCMPGAIAPKALGCLPLWSHPRTQVRESWQPSTPARGINFRFDLSIAMRDSG